jgi:hypothetical protein
VVEDLEGVVTPRLELEALVRLRVFDHDRQPILGRVPDERDVDAVVRPACELSCGRLEHLSTV